MDIYIYMYNDQKNVWHPPEGKCHVLGKGFGRALTQTIEKRNEKVRERRAQRLRQKKWSRE